MWYSESGVVHDCIVSWSLPSFLLLPNQYFVHILLLVTETMLLSRIIGSRRMTVEIISWSISSKIWDRRYLFWGWFLFYNIVLLAFFSFAIILLRKREQVLLLYLRSFCPVTIRLSVLCLFLGVLCTRLCLWNFLVVLTSFCGIQYILCKTANLNSQNDRKLGFNYRLMQVKSIAEGSKESILQYFRSSLSYLLTNVGSFVLSIFEWPF